MFLFSFELLIPIVVIGLIVMAIAAFSSDRREPDPAGRRPFAVYLFSVLFVTLFITLFAAIGLVSSIVRIALPENLPVGTVTYGTDGVGVGQRVEPVPAFQPGQTVAPVPAFQPGQTVAPFRPFDPNDEHIRDAVRSGLIAIAALLVLFFHARRARELERDSAFVEGPVRRTYHVYLYAVCFVAVLTTLVAGAVAAYGLFRIVSPGTTGTFGSPGVERDEGIVQLVTAGILALAAYGIFAFHWRRVPGRATPKGEAPPAPTTA